MWQKILTLAATFSTAACLAAVDVNTATEAELDSINGIGPAMSGKILAERKNGNFKDWKDLMARVKGVREKNAIKLSTQGLTVNKAAFMDAQGASEAQK